MILFASSRSKNPTPATTATTATLTAAALGLVGLIALAPGCPAADRTLNIYWTDVEGGGATLIVTPAGESVLIDSGNPGVRDPGRIHKTASQIAGLKKI